MNIEIDPQGIAQGASLCETTAPTKLAGKFTLKRAWPISCRRGHFDLLLPRQADCSNNRGGDDNAVSRFSHSGIIGEHEAKVKAASFCLFEGDRSRWEGGGRAPRSFPPSQDPTISGLLSRQPIPESMDEAMDLPFFAARCGPPHNHWR